MENINVQLFDEELIALRDLSPNPSPQKDKKIAAYSFDFVAVWGFLFLASAIAFTVTIVEGFPVKPLCLIATFCICTVYIIANYRSGYIFDFTSHMLYYCHKAGFLWRTIVPLGSLDKAIAFVVNSENEGYNNYLLLVWGEGEIGTDDLERFVTAKRQHRQVEVFKLLEGELEEVNRQGEILAERIGSHYFFGEVGKSRYLGSRYQLHSRERLLGWKDVLLFSLGFATISLLVGWLG